MTNIAGIFKRLNIQELREFLFHGVECSEYDNRTYNERVEIPYQDLCEILHREFPDLKKYEAMLNIIYEYSEAIKDVYMEIGLQSGFTLANQLLQKKE